MGDASAVVPVDSPPGPLLEGLVNSPIELAAGDEKQQTPTESAAASPHDPAAEKGAAPEEPAADWSGSDAAEVVDGDDSGSAAEEKESAMGVRIRQIEPFPQVISGGWGGGGGGAGGGGYGRGQTDPER